MTQIQTTKHQPIDIVIEQRRTRIRRSVGMMMLSFRDKGDADTIAASYVTALEDLPAWSVEKALLRFMRAEVPDRNHAFAPSAAEVHAEARKVKFKLFYDVLKRFEDADSDKSLPEEERAEALRMIRLMNGIVMGHEPWSAVDQLLEAEARKGAP